jgi:hypothetical protein
LFFQIDISFDLALMLQRQRQRTNIPKNVQNLSEVDVKFPANEYDKAPLDLYWYAKSATGMPLLQFLAYYQTIEFYFPVYSKIDFQRRVKNILKDPGFNSNRDADVGRLISAMRASGNIGFGDEKSQLKATIKECVDQDEIRAFLTLSDEKKNFFVSKTKGLTDQKISINNPQLDLRDEVAERVYDIRCKIVHTKNSFMDSESELLLPFSKEAELLYFDIELVQYIAQRALITGSTSMVIS